MYQLLAKGTLDVAFLTYLTFRLPLSSAPQRSFFEGPTCRTQGDEALGGNQVHPEEAHQRQRAEHQQRDIGAEKVSGVRGSWLCGYEGGVGEWVGRCA